MSEHRNAPWSRGECPGCGKEILLARSEATYGPRYCTACETWKQAEAEFQAERDALMQRISELEKASGRPENTRKVVQMETMQEQRLLVLYDDGTIWITDLDTGSWESVPLPPGCNGGGT
jgi:hypothetical protein